MIQLDSDSTYGSTVSVNLGSLGNASATIPGKIGHASSHFRSRSTSTGDNRARRRHAVVPL
jgi:hypothetical protein